MMMWLWGSRMAWLGGDDTEDMCYGSRVRHRLLVGGIRAGLSIVLSKLDRVGGVPRSQCLERDGQGLERRMKKDCRQ